MGSIRAIETDSVHRLHAGQVVLELQQAVKELLENSLDSGATSVEVKIKDHGMDSIEVIDNGSGILEEDWPSIGLKHHTSKLPALSALPHVTTFGFRGEAISALCALCESVIVVTATKETAPLGAIIKLGRDGKVIDSTGRVARPRGTTITLTGLFTPLPVRRKEFERTAKREYTKALTTLTSYALVPASVSKEDGREGVRLKVESMASGKNGKRNAVIVTDGRGSLRSSVTAVWGPKALENIIDVDVELEVGVDRMMAKREGLDNASQAVKVTGLISSATWGQGRSSADRQFYYINGRPVDLPVIAKAVNEVYKSFNTHQLPLVILDFTVPRESVDINVSPDKRSIFLHSEAQLVEALRTALDRFFQPSRSTFTMGGASQKVTLVQSSLLPRKESIILDEEEEDEEQARAGAEEEEQTAESLSTQGDDPENSDKENVPVPMDPISDSDETPEPISPPSKRARPSAVPSTREIPTTTSRAVRTISTTNASWSPDRVSKTPTSVSRRQERTNLRKRLEGYASQATGSVVEMLQVEEDELESEEEVVSQQSRLISTSSGPRARGQHHEAVDERLNEIDNVHTEDKEEEEEEEEEEEVASTSRASRRRRTISPDAVEDADIEATTKDNSLSSEEWLEQTDGDVNMGSTENVTPQSESISGPFRARQRSLTPSFNDDTSDEDEIAYLAAPTGTRMQGASSSSNTFRDEITSTAANGEVTLSFNLDRLRETHRKRRKLGRTRDKATKDAYSLLTQGGISSAAGIDNKDLASAEEALSRVISKSDFERMEVLGQFNKGFIIARLRRETKEGTKGTDDMFIVDQHASDEKYNFETLQQTTVIKAQSLIRPRPLQLTAGDEIVAVENLDILKSNGFEVEIDEDKIPGRGERIKLSAMPVSKETTFDFKDLEQLLHLLSDGSRPAGQMVRCTKARSMFAMRACRKSVMIGKSLTKNQMITLLKNMGTIDQPWNCPHGRPTMRHLTKLDCTSGYTSSRIDWAAWSPPV